MVTNHEHLITKCIWSSYCREVRSVIRARKIYLIELKLGRNDGYFNRQEIRKRIAEARELKNLYSDIILNGLEGK